MDRPAYVWDYQINQRQFEEILAGQLTIGRLNRDWAAWRLLEYASYDEMIRLIGFPALIKDWPRWRASIRSEGRRRGFDFLVEWLPKNHPELGRDE